MTAALELADTGNKFIWLKKVWGNLACDPYTYLYSA
jgi:hypothetical protein